MLIDFFTTLRAAKLPVSVREYLTLLEALKAGVIGESVDDFYFLARTTLVKDEALFDKFDRAFSAYFKGIALRTDFTQEVPLEWLCKTFELVSINPQDLESRPQSLAVTEEIRDRGQNKHLEMIGPTAIGAPVFRLRPHRVARGVGVVGLAAVPVDVE